LDLVPANCTPKRPALAELPTAEEVNEGHGNAPVSVSRPSRREEERVSSLHQVTLRFGFEIDFVCAR